MGIRARPNLEASQLEDHRNITGMLTRLFALAALLGCTACSFFPMPDRFGARPIPYQDLPGWDYDNHLAALDAFIPTCEVFSRKARNTSAGSDIEISADTWLSLCDDAKRSRLDAWQAKLFFERRFVPFRINNNGKEQGLFTGYYEPVLYGSYRKQGDFMYPVYAVPPELARQKPYFTRQQIDNGALAGHKLELLWVDDPVMLFFLHIQGSGRIRLTNGKETYIGYADQNGHPYVGLGKLMMDESILAKDNVNFFTIRQWLYTHTDQAFAMMNRNPSYVFFKKRETPGAVGAAGVVLTPERSIAVDNHYIPYGLPVFMQAELPAFPDSPPAPFNRLVIAQDTGGAIKGPVRADVFFGAGDEAEYLAGYMKYRGMYNLLVPKEAASQLE